MPWQRIHVGALLLARFLLFIHLAYECQHVSLSLFGSFCSYFASYPPRLGVPVYHSLLHIFHFFPHSNLLCINPKFYLIQFKSHSKKKIVLKTSEKKNYTHTYTQLRFESKKYFMSNKMKSNEKNIALRTNANILLSIKSCCRFFLFFILRFPFPI